MTGAQGLIARLELERHPEGGWYRETHRSQVVLPRAALPDGYASDRTAVTSILYLLEAGARSRRHRVRSEELWLHQGGDPLALRVEAPDGATHAIVLGADEGMRLQYAVPPGWWQCAQACDGPHGYALLGCVVAPGFEFEDFELGDAQVEA